MLDTPIRVYRSVANSTDIETWVLPPAHMQLVFDRSDPGEVIVYACGDLAYERATSSGQRHADANTTARMVANLEERGKAHLTQLKLGPNRYEYQVTKR